MFESTDVHLQSSKCVSGSTQNAYRLLLESLEIKRERRYLKITASRVSELVVLIVHVNQLVYEAFIDVVRVSLYSLQRLGEGSRA